MPRSAAAVAHELNVNMHALVSISTFSVCRARPFNHMPLICATYMEEHATDTRINIRIIARMLFALADISSHCTSRMRVPVMSKLLSSVRQVHVHALWLKAQSLAA